MGEAIDVEEHLLQDVVRVGLARVATKATGDLRVEVLAVELVEQSEALLGLRQSEALHEARRQGVTQRLRGACPVGDEREHVLGLRHLSLE